MFGRVLNQPTPTPAVEVQVQVDISDKNLCNYLDHQMVSVLRVFYYETLAALCRNL